jgi:hypothetical protein
MIAVQIGDPELAQAPRFILRFSKDLRPGLPPAMVQFVEFMLAAQIQPDDDRPTISVVLAERCIRREDTALPLPDAPIPPWSLPQSKCNPSTLT